MMVILKKALETAIKLSKYDRRAWDKLYFGIRTDIKLGIKHGFGSGSILGNFIDFNDDDELDGSKIQLKYKTGTTYKTRCRCGRRNGGRCRFCNRSNKKYRRSRFSKYKRVRNRF